MGDLQSNFFFRRNIFFCLLTYLFNSFFLTTHCKSSFGYYKENNEMCAINVLKACTLSRISSARVTFYIQNCFYSELLEKKNFPE